MTARPDATILTSIAAAVDAAGSSGRPIDAAASDAEAICVNEHVHFTCCRRKAKN